MRPAGSRQVPFSAAGVLAWRFALQKGDSLFTGEPFIYKIE